MAISRNPLDVLRWYPLVMTDIAMENGPVEIVDLSIESGGSFHIVMDIFTSIVYPLDPRFIHCSVVNPLCYGKRLP